MKYGQVDLCLVHETRYCIWTTLQINDPNPKTIIPFILIACHFLAANIFVLLYMLFVFVLPINLHENPKSKAHTYCCTGPAMSSTIACPVYAHCNTCSAYYWVVPGELADHGNLVHKNMWSASFDFNLTTSYLCTRSLGGAKRVS